MIRFISFIFFILLLIAVGVHFNVLGVIFSFQENSEYTSNATTTIEVMPVSRALADVRNGVQSVSKLVQKVSTSGPLKALSPMYGTAITVKGTILETNIARALEGKMPLTENALLNTAAQRKAEDILLQQYFEHESPLGKGPADLIAETGYEYITVGENLALGHFKDDKALVTAWLNSPGHRENIMNSKFSEIGIGIAKGEYEGQMVWVAVQEFGKPASLCPSVDRVLAQDIEQSKENLRAKEVQIENLKAEIEKYNRSSSEYRNKVRTYNVIVNEYNALVEEVKAMIQAYNEKVQAFNSCVQG